MRKELLKGIEHDGTDARRDALGCCCWRRVPCDRATVAGAEDTVAFTIKDARITESSGLAVDPAGNLYWTVNDSGDRGVAYGIGLDGTVQGTLNFRAQPEDVEAVAVHEDGSTLPISATTRPAPLRVYFYEPQGQRSDGDLSRVRLPAIPMDRTTPRRYSSMSPGCSS